MPQPDGMADLVRYYIARDIRLIHRREIRPTNSDNPLSLHVEQARERHELRFTKENREISRRIPENLRNGHRSPAPIDHRVA